MHTKFAYLNSMCDSSCELVCYILNSMCDSSCELVTKCFTYAYY